MADDIETTGIVTAQRDIAASAGRIFELIADPAQQPRWDGNDNLAEAAAGQRVHAVGDVFVTTLTSGNTRENHVVEFAEGRRIAWRPAEPGSPPPGHLWRWELEPLGSGRTRVVHTYDWTRLQDPTRLARARATTPDNLQASLVRLAGLAEGVKRDSSPRTRLGTLGVWARQSELDAGLAHDLEAMGYGGVWIGGSPGDLALAGELLDATEQLVVATGIVNVWQSPAPQIAAAHRSLTSRFPGRFLLGIGIGHPESTSDYRHPYRALVEYLDVLDGEGVPQHERVLAALGPKVLRLARDRTAGAHPYLVTPEHTRQAREILGPDRLLAPEQKVVVEPDAARGRSIGRPAVERPYLGLSNYLANLRRLGFSDADFADGGSDELIDALVAHGDAAAVAQRLRAHLEAGADHVPVQLVTERGADRRDRTAAYRAVAEAVIG